jgi:hypothetical protein
MELNYQRGLEEELMELKLEDQIKWIKSFIVSMVDRSEPRSGREVFYMWLSDVLEENYPGV